MSLLVVCITLLVLLFLGLPIALIMGISGLVYFLLTGGLEYFPMVVNRLYSGIDSFVLVCIPFFILAGDMMNRSGITEKLVRFSNLFVGRLPGSLAQANVVSSGIFASISGSALGDIAAIGSVFIPAMKREGYGGRFSAAVTAASAIVSPIIPPSLIIILYAAVMDTSIGAMFVAALIPGFLMVAGDMIIVHLLSVKRRYPRRTEAVGFSEAVRCTRDALIALVMPVIIIGGIVGGVFTPTEAAAVAVSYAFIVGGLVFRKMRAKDIIQSIYSSALSSGKLFFIIACVGILAWAFAMEDVPQQIVAVFSGLLAHPWLILLSINLFLLFMGMWLDLTANIFLFAPILGPLVVKAGIDPLHFSMIFLLNVNLGNITPPLGIILFATAELSLEKVHDIVRDLWAFWIIKAIVLGIVTYMPWISLWMPGIFGFSH
jgi:tripartite ATP-independent transporter DctM subunit